MPALRPPRRESLPLRQLAAEPRHRPRPLRRPDRPALHPAGRVPARPPRSSSSPRSLDGLDGLLARRLNAASRFGAELDSLADFVNFGVAPALLVYWLALAEAPDALWTAPLVFAVCACLRLARFNATATRRSSASRTSSASPPRPGRSSACCRPTSPSPASPTPVRQPWLVAAWLVLVGLLMICRLRTLAPKGLRVRARARALAPRRRGAGRRPRRLAPLAPDDPSRRRLPRRAPRRRRRRPPPAGRAADRRLTCDPRPSPRSYRRWAPVYDQTFGAVTMTGRRRAVAQVNRRGGRVLEVGVGTGLVALPLRPAPRGHRHRLLRRDARQGRGPGRRPRPRPGRRPPPDGRARARLPRRELRHRGGDAPASRSSPSPSASSPRWPGSAAPAARS